MCLSESAGFTGSSSISSTKSFYISRELGAVCDRSHALRELELTEHEALRVIVPMNVLSRVFGGARAGKMRG
jgi:hypothetical protein